MCRHRGLPLTDGVGWRLVLPDDTITFGDLAHGPTTQTPSAQCGDLLLRDRLGNWTYQLAVVVDDLLHGIDLVVRGDDLFASTGRQILLAQLLGRESPPAFFHHGLVMQTPTQKLSKSDGASGVRDLRAAGWTPARASATPPTSVASSLDRATSRSRTCRTSSFANARPARSGLAAPACARPLPRPPRRSRART